MENLEKSTGGEAGRGWTVETGNGGDGGEGGEGQESASATMFWEPGRWTRLLVNSELPLLPGQPGRRNPEQRLCERLVVGK